MKNNTTSSLIKFVIISFISMILTGCATREQIVYFQGDQSTLEQELNYTPTLQPDDLLVITISARDFEATKPFNQVNYYYQSQDQTRHLTYLIDEEGYIDYPVVGKIKLGGLTRSQAIQHMKTILSEYIIDPGVTINITNFKVTVLGEVLKPGTYDVPNERITVLEALGLAGDLTINGLRNNVLVVREVEGESTFHRIDLTSNEVFQSPVYFLKQNDVIYVEPNKAQINSSAYNRNLPIFVSIVGLIITVISVLTR